MSSIEPPLEERERYRSMCWEKAVHAFATSYLFQKRAHKLRRWLLRLNYFGIAVPFTIGTVALAFGAFDFLGAVIAIGAALLVVQAIINLWVLLDGWVDKYSYANTSAAANGSLSAKYRQLGVDPPASTASLKQEYALTQAEDESRREQDMREHIKDTELRMGMRAALRQFQKECSACGNVPTSMQPTNCGVCGDFKYSG